MSITGNKGEWSEAYVFLKLLAEGKLFAADEQLNRINNMFFPIIKIIREETIGLLYEYRPNIIDSKIEIYCNGSQVFTLPASTFAEEANSLFDDICSQDVGRGSFEIIRTEAFMRRIYMNRLRAPSNEKADINIEIHDINTGYENIVGFSIKSELGMPPTLLNAGQTTNFIYKVEGLDRTNVTAINAIETSRKIKDRVQAITDSGGNLVFHSMANSIFNENLIMIDSQMPSIVAQMLIGYYSDVATDCFNLADYISRLNPISRNTNFYKHKIKEMLCAIALGMKPATAWDGTDEATGGYIIVKAGGDVLAYHIYNREAFKNYLLNNTKLESGSSSRHNYGTLYEKDGEIFINLNLQIRFI